MVYEIKNILKEKFPVSVDFARFVSHIIKSHISKSKIKHLLQANNSIYLDVGAGDKKGRDGWTTIDLTDNCDIYWDLNKGLPFPDESISKIYSSHFLEHLTFKEGQKFLDECFRVLLPGGAFSVCVPNSRMYIEAYLNSTSLDKDYFQYGPAYNQTTLIDYVNYTAYMDGHHKYMFDEDNLIYLLESKGFRSVRLRGFDPDLDLEFRDFESIYAESEK
ncbi:MAG: methyltransferase domain-containing protein [Candidatus Sedimenticola sp. 6PFRAG7]